MTAKTKNGLIAVTVTVVIAAAIYFYVKSKNPSKEQKVKDIVLSDKTVISKNGKSYQENFSGYMGLGDDFIDAWWKAIQKNESSFVHLDNVCDVNTGRVISKIN